MYSNVDELFPECSAGQAATLMAMGDVMDQVAEAASRSTDDEALAARLQTTSEVVANIRDATPNGVTLEDLLGFLVTLGYDVKIEVTKAAPGKQAWLYAADRLPDSDGSWVHPHELMLLELIESDYAGSVDFDCEE